MVTILRHNSLDRDFANIEALGCAQCGIPGRYFLIVLPLLIKMAFEVHDQLFHGWSKIFPLKRHSYDLRDAKIIKYPVLPEKEAQCPQTISPELATSRSGLQPLP